MSEDLDSDRRRALLQSLGVLGALGTGAVSGAPEDEEREPPATSPVYSDRSSPESPGFLKVTERSQTEAVIEWTFLRDRPRGRPSSGIDQYEIFLDTERIATFGSGRSSGDSYTITGLDPETGYRASVRGIDGAGNEGALSSVVIPPARMESFTHDCTDLATLSEHSDRSALCVDSSNPEHFRTPDGTADEGRITRAGTTDDTAVAYQLPGMADALTVQFHKHTDAEGWVHVYASADGGDSWSRVETSFETYGEIDGSWLHHEITADSLGDGADEIKLVLTGGDEPWSGQLGHVSIDYYQDTVGPRPPQQQLPARATGDGLEISWSGPRPLQAVDHYIVTLGGEEYATVPAGTTKVTIGGLETGTTHEVGVSAVDVRGMESARLTEQHALLRDDCSALSTTAFGTDTDRLTVDRSNPQYFERTDGSHDGARITRTDTDDASLVYEIPSYTSRLTVEFHTHVEHGGELLIDGKRTNDYYDGSVEQYGDTEGDWIHERHVLNGSANRSELTITGGSKAWGSQIGHVGYAYDPAPDPEAPPTPTSVSASTLSASSAEVTWSDGRASWYAAIYVDGRKWKVDGGDTRTVLHGLSPGTHEIGVSLFNETHTESERVTTTVEIPGSPSETLVHDCTALDTLSSDSDRDALRVDTSNPQYFERPDGSTDEGRLTRSGTTEAISAIYSFPGDARSVTLQFHEHEQHGGSIEVYESTDGGETTSRVQTTASTYGDTDGSWTHQEITVDSFSEGVRDVAVVLTGGSKPWSGQLGHVEIDYAGDTTAPPSAEVTLFPHFDARKLDLGWELSSRPGDIDHFLVTVDGEEYAQVAPDETDLLIDGLEPDTRYEVGVTVVDTAGNESETRTAESRTHEAVIDDCSNLNQTAFDTDTDRLTVDRSNPQYFERPDGSADEARITRTDTDDATFVYKVPGETEYLTIEFHRHVEHGGELLVDERPIQAHDGGRVRRYGESDGWIHELYELKSPANLSTITITGGSRAWGSQIGHIEYSHVRAVSGGPGPAEIRDLHVSQLSESAVQLTWQLGGGSGHAYTAISVDGEKVDEYRRLDTQKDVLGTVLTDLSPGTHEIGLGAVSDYFEAAEPVRRTVDLPAEPVSTFEHDCSDFDAISDLAPWYALDLDDSNPASFERPDGSADDGRLVRSTVYNPGAVVYATPKPVAAATAEFHEHVEHSGWVDVYQSTDGAETWSPVDSSVETYGSTDDGWIHHELTATGFAEESTHVKFELTGDRDGVAWSPQLGHVQLEYDG